VLGLAPSTRYDFAIRAQDLGYNVSPPSGAVSATTAASTDTQAPMAPGSLVVWYQFCGEVLLMWNQSTDDQDPQAAIRYQVLIDGVVDQLGATRAPAARSRTGTTAATRSWSGQSTAPATCRRRATR
jgi:hypothetical protein